MGQFGRDSAGAAQNTNGYPASRGGASGNFRAPRQQKDNGVLLVFVAFVTRLGWVRPGGDPSRMTSPPLTAARTSFMEELKTTKGRNLSLPVHIVIVILLIAIGIGRPLC